MRLLIFLALAGCATKTPLIVETPGGTSLLITQNRRLETSACGCSLNPLGGVAREQNYQTSLKRASRRIIPIAVGATFSDGTLPSGSAWNERAKHTVDALRTLEYEVIAPSAEDLALGEPFLRIVRKNDHILATNWRAKSGSQFWKTRMEFGLDGMQLVLFSVTQKSRSRRVVVDDAASALKREISKLPQAPRVIIVLSSLTPAENERVVESVPDIHIVAGSTADEARTLEAYRADQYVAGADSKGRSLYRIDLDSKDGFYNEDAVERALDTREHWTRSIAEINAELKSEKDPARVDRLRERIQNMTSYLERTKSIARRDSKTSSKAELIPLSVQWQ